MLGALEHLYPISKRCRFKREGRVLTKGEPIIVPCITLDTGADSGNYIGRQLLQKCPNTKLKPCKHRVRLGDGGTMMTIQDSVVLTIQLLRDNSFHSEPLPMEFFVVDQLGEEMIIGVPALMTDCFDYLLEVLDATTLLDYERSAKQATDLQRLFLDFETELSQRKPRREKLDRLIEQSKDLGKAYRKKRARLRTITANDPNELPVGELFDAWASVLPSCPEELDTPDPVSIAENILYFMEISPEEARIEYLAMLDEHISDGMKKAVPQVLTLLQSDLAIKVFVPATWNGISVAPVTMQVVGDLPARMYARPRPVRSELYESAKKEFDRLRKYFYVDSDSPIASPLVIAPKATYPYIRFCGDYRRVNEYISIPQQPIPIVHLEIMKAAQFRYFVDLDMCNSFHQIPLAREFSELLSVQTPWGLVRPKFLPEGVGPASGLLQHLVRDIFTDFSDWTVVIFDNFLVLAKSYDDAYIKLEKVLLRCKDYGIVLKLKKSYIGVEQVTFFGYQISHSKWGLSDSRKQSISAITFPTDKKSMQSFLGAALFMHHHIPNYSQWAAKLYEMVHQDFSWDPEAWSFDYKAHFDKFKLALVDAMVLHFPRYDLPWVLRVDASDYAVGAALFQVSANAEGAPEEQLIALSSTKFSEPAKSWDTYKREAFAIYRGVFGFDYYLRGKEFLLESDHRNLQWIEASQSAIVIRWRVLLQSFSFKVRHIPGKQNLVADWLSRSGCADYGAVNIMDTQPVDNAFGEIMRQVHGGRHLHWGATRTYELAKKLFPDATISQAAVREYVRTCSICQKCRNVGIKPLAAQALSLKPPTYRRTIGVDIVTVTPPDKFGHCCLILLVEHFSHFPQAYPSKNYSAQSVARILFKHFTTFGVFDEVASDPGSAFMAEVVQQLVYWLGMAHKVSLIGRHESNGCEGSAQQYLRHLTTLVADERLIDIWSDDTVLPLINYSLASFPTSETGGYTPFELKYGRRDASYMRLPAAGDLTSSAHDFIKALELNIATVRDASLKFQQKMVEERRTAAGRASSYEYGDFVLWDPLETPWDFKETKLTPRYAGPYQVIRQVKNDVHCKHVNLGTEHTFHVSRLHPFFGTYDDALRVSQLDRNQYLIKSINYFRGNVFKRSSLTFNISFDDGSVIDVPYSADLFNSAPFAAYAASRPCLLPLRSATSALALHSLSDTNKLMITSVSPGADAYLNIRFFDGRTSAWFDSLELPNPAVDYVVHCRVVRWLTKTRSRVAVYCDIFAAEYKLAHSDVIMYLYSATLPSFTVIDESYRPLYPRIFA